MHCNRMRVCSEPCSREKARVDRIDSKALLKVCNQCARELKAHRKYGVQAYSQEEGQTQGQGQGQGQGSEGDSIAGTGGRAAGAGAGSSR